jgi:hypothetical protein
MHDRANELLRIPIPHTWVNKDKRKEVRAVAEESFDGRERLRILLLRIVVLGSSRRTVAVAPSNTLALCAFDTDVTIMQ